MEYETAGDGSLIPQNPAQQIAEHTGHPEYACADEITELLEAEIGIDFTSAQRVLIASVVARYLP